MAEESDPLPRPLPHTRLPQRIRHDPARRPRWSGCKLRRRDEQTKGPKRLQIESRERPKRQYRQEVHDAHEAERVLLPVLGAADADAPFDGVEEPDRDAGEEEGGRGAGQGVDAAGVS